MTPNLLLPLLWVALASPAAPAPTPRSPLADTPAGWAQRSREALAQGDELAAAEAAHRSLLLDPQQPALRRLLRRLDPDLAEPAPSWALLPLDAPVPKPWTVAAVEALAWHGGVRLRVDGRLTTWRQALLVARDPGRAAPLAVPAGADIHRLRRWPAAGGPPVALTPKEAARWAQAPGDRLELAWVVDRPAQAQDGAVLRMAGPWPARRGRFEVDPGRERGWWVQGLGLGAPRRRGGTYAWRLPALPEAARRPDAADWLMDEPAVLVGRAPDGVTFARAAYTPPAAPAAVLAGAALRARPVAARIAAAIDRYDTPAALAPALRAAGVEAWVVAARARWQRPRDDLPRSAALLPVRVVWLPAEGRVIPPKGVAAADLAAADGAVLDGSGRWVRLPAPTARSAREGAVEQRGPRVVVVHGADPTSWPGARRLGPLTLQASARRWQSPAPHRPWGRRAWHGPAYTRWLGAALESHVVYTTDRPPEGAEVRGPSGARWRRGVRARPAGAEVTSQITLPAGPLPKSAWAAFAAFCAAVERAEAGAR